MAQVGVKKYVVAFLLIIVIVIAQITKIKWNYNKTMQLNVQ